MGLEFAIHTFYCGVYLVVYTLVVITYSACILYDPVMYVLHMLHNTVVPHGIMCHIVDCEYVAHTPCHTAQDDIALTKLHGAISYGMM